MGTYFCDPSRHLQEPPGPPGPKSQKSLKKGLFGGLEKSLKKYPKKSKNTDFRTFLGIFSVFLDFFGYFLRLFSRPPKRPFLRLFCDFGPGGPGDSCKWRLGSQTYLVNISARMVLVLDVKTEPQSGIPWPCYRGHLGPSGPKWQMESEKMSCRGPSRPWGPKSPKRKVSPERSVVTNRICKCRCHKARHVQVRRAVGRRSTCVLKETPLNKGPLVRVVETVVLENGRFVPCRKQVVLTKNGGNSDSAFYPQKQGILLLKQTLEIDEKYDNGGCHPDKMTVCKKHAFDNPGR